MSMDPNARCTKTHEWMRLEGEVYAYGITDHTQNALSDIVFVDLHGIWALFAAYLGRQLSQRLPSLSCTAIGSEYNGIGLGWAALRRALF